MCLTKLHLIYISYDQFFFCSLYNYTCQFLQNMVLHSPHAHNRLIKSTTLLRSRLYRVPRAEKPSWPCSLTDPSRLRPSTYRLEWSTELFSSTLTFSTGTGILTCWAPGVLPLYLFYLLFIVCIVFCVLSGFGWGFKVLSLLSRILFNS